LSLLPLSLLPQTGRILLLFGQNQKIDCRKGVLVMKSLFLSSCLVLIVTALPCVAREWTDASGAYTFEGDLIAASDGTIVLRRTKGELEAYQTSQLSEADQKFVADHLESNKDKKPADEMQTWTSRGGFNFRGRVIGYGTQDVTLKHERGTTKVNEKSIEELDEFYQMMIPKIVAEFDDPKVKSIEDLSSWGRKLRGKTKSFRIDGVMMRMENGEKLAVPLFLFAAKERDVLDEGLEKWNARATEEHERKREDFLAQTAAEEYQRNLAAEAQVNRQIQMMQLEMLAVNSGIAEVWEVQMIPLAGVAARPMAVLVTAQNSQAARVMAEQRYRGFASGAVRQVSY
jgi:hypothetical protein